MKKIISLVTVLAMALLICGTLAVFAEEAVASELVAGDANSDGLVSGKDVTVIKRYIAGHSIAINASCADVNADGSINAKDVTILKRYIAGHDVDLVLPPSAHEHVGLEDCVCDTCGYESHTFDGAWYHDKDEHWQIGSCSNIDHKGNVAAHIDENGDCVCDVCAYADHEYSDEWAYDETHHWHDAVCDHKDEKSGYSEHKLQNGVCTCGYEDPTDKPVELPVVPA